MWKALLTIPLQLVCQVAVPGSNGTGNPSFAVDTRVPQAASTVSPDYALKTPKATQELPEGYTAFPDIGVAYKYYPDEITWNQARRVCITDGSALAEIDTFQKIKYALRVKKDEGCGLAVGIHRLFDHSEWTSLKTGLGVSMIPWAPVSYNETKRRNCMAMYYDGRGLAAGFCNSAISPFICEIQLPID